MRNPDRKIRKEAANALCYINSSGTRKGWEKAIDKVIRQNGYNSDEAHDFCQMILAKVESFKEIERLYAKDTHWYGPPGKMKLKCPMWFSEFTKIFYYDEQYWVDDRPFPALPMAMEYGFKAHGNTRSDSPLVETGFLRG